MRCSLKIPLLCVSFAALSVAQTTTTVCTPISLTTLDSAYQQNFNTLANTGVTASTLPAGWALSETGSSAARDGAYRISDGGANNGDTYSVGTTASADRAFGSLNSGTLDPVFGACFVNNTGSTINQLAIAYRGEQWRLGTAGRADRLDFQYAIAPTDLGVGTYFDADQLDFSSPTTTGPTGALNGNTVGADVSFTLTGLTIANGQTFFVRWRTADVAGGDDTLAVDDFSLTPKAGGVPVTCTPTHSFISQLQGSGSISPLANNTNVSVEGIVTGVKSNGFFIQDAGDGNTATSDGIFIFRGGAVPFVTGDKVCVSGPIVEFTYSASPNGPFLTEITTPNSATLVNSGNPLPPAVPLVADGTGLDLFERFEAMRVSVPSITVTGPTESAASGSVFFGVLTGTAAPRREPGIKIPDPLPAGAPAGIPRFDSNPELLMVDPDGQVGAPVINTAAGQVITNLAGVLDVDSYVTGGLRSNNRLYTLLPNVGGAPVLTGNITFTPVPDASADELTVGNFNLENFGDTDINSIRIIKASRAIRDAMKSPDVIGLEEAQSLAAIQTLALRVNQDTVTAGQPNPNYAASVLQTTGGSIFAGLLYKTGRITNVNLSLLPVGVNPANGGILNDRQTLVLTGLATRAGSDSGLPITILVNHLRSLIDVDTDTVRVKRRAQAEFLANELDARDANGETVISVGDYNAFEFNDGFVDSLGTIKGMPTPADQVTLASIDLVNPDYINLTDVAPVNQRYSYKFVGNAQTLDHIIVNGRAFTRFKRIAWAHNNADFPDSLRTDPTRSERVSDHDMPVAVFALPLEVSSKIGFVRSGFVLNRATGQYQGNVYLTNTTGQTIAGPVHIFFNNLVSGVTLANASGTYNGSAYLTTANAIAPGATVTVPVRFTNPTNKPITYTQKIFSINF